MYSVRAVHDSRSQPMRGNAGAPTYVVRELRHRDQNNQRTERAVGQSNFAL